MRFGTDGIRGHADSDLTNDLAYAVGRAAADVVGAQSGHRAVIGADPRASSPRIVAAVSAGLAAGGVNVVDLGVVPTPIVAGEAAHSGALGVMVSASHNPFHDNGIKVFGPGGRKLDDDAQAGIEAAMAAGNASGDLEIREGQVSVANTDEVTARYRDRVVSAVGARALDGLHVVLDGANGAGSRIGPDVFAHLGARVTTIGVSPDGRNINDGFGATAPGALAAAVVDHGADMGLALDGDADRLIAVDANGSVVDGDHVMCVLAHDMRSRGVLVDDTVVVTVMSNLGFHIAMRDAEIRVITTPVGDRAVVAAMEAAGASLGGEQSGHVIMAAYSATGDGILTGAALAAAVARSRRPLADLAAVMTSLPQVLVNVVTSERTGDVPADVAAEADQVASELGDAGRVLVRASGTEPLLRIMVEAPTPAAADAAAQRIAAVAGRHRDIAG